MVEREFKISLTQGVGGSIQGKSTIYKLLSKITTDEKLIAEGEYLKHLYKTDKPAYDSEKNSFNGFGGFIIGDFSYRSVENCVEYVPAIGFDIDAIQSKEEYDKIYESLKSWEYTFILLPSISGLGLRIIVFSESTKETHKLFYENICNEICSVSGIKSKQAIVEAFKGLGYTSDTWIPFLKKNAHIDTKTSDISRFWYYSGLERNEIYLNQESKIFKITPKSENKEEEKPKEFPKFHNKSYLYVFTEMDKIEHLVKKVEAHGIDITAGFTEWFKVGLGIAHQFGEAGREVYHRVCSFHPDYKRSECEKEFSRCIAKSDKGSVTIASVFQAFQDYGVGIDYADLVEEHKEKFDEYYQRQKIEESIAQEIPKLSGREQEAKIITACLTIELMYEEILEDLPKFGHDCFSEGIYRTVFNAIEKTASEGEDINFDTIYNKLKFNNFDLVEFKKFKGIRVNKDDVLSISQIVYELSLKRKSIALCRDIENKLLTDEKTTDVIDGFLSDLSGISDTGNTSTERTLAQIFRDVLEDLHKGLELREKTDDNLPLGVPSGLKDLDAVLAGFHKTDLNYLAGRPGMGKTSLVLDFAKAAAFAGKRVGIFSLEMSSKQLGQRMVSGFAGVEGTKFRSADFDEHELFKIQTALKSYKQLPIIIDDKGGVTPEYVKRVASKWKRKEGLDLIIIDYLQLMNTMRWLNDTSKATELSNKLKGIAKSLDIPVIALSQLSRAVEIRGGSKRPQLSDLRDSGSLEQDADRVMFIYRPDYYGIIEDEEGQSLKGVTEIIIAKNRHGALKTVKVGFDEKTTSFKDLEEPVFETSSPSLSESEHVFTIPVQTPDNNLISRPAKVNDDQDIPF